MTLSMPAVAPPVTLTIDGQAVTAPAGATVWEAARLAGIDVPVLCHQPDLRPVGECRVCLVEVAGARTLVAACVRPVEPGLDVKTDTERVRAARRTVIELLLSDHPAPCRRQVEFGACELELLAEQAGLRASRFAPSPRPRPFDDTSPVIIVDHTACILCDRCIRGCDEVQVNEVINRTGKGYTARIAFDYDLPMGRSTCVSCGECAARCPTGALTDRPIWEVPRAEMRRRRRGG